MIALDDEKKHARAKKEEAQERRIAREDLRAVMRTVEGRRFVWRVLTFYAPGADAQLFGEQTHAAAQHAGARHVAARIVVDLQRDAPLEMIEMLAENLLKPQQLKAREKEIHEKPPDVESPNPDYDPLERANPEEEDGP